MTITLSLIVLAVLGLLLYAFTNGKPSEVGRLVFACAFLALCLGAAPHIPRLR